MSKVVKSIKFDSDSIEVIESILNKPVNKTRKLKFNNVIEYLVETNPEFVDEKEFIAKKKLMKNIKRTKPE